MAHINDYGICKSAYDIKKKVMPLREKGKIIVTTNGCFDLIHAGHIEYLTEAAALGDILIVGVNSDSSVKKLKGPERPIQNEYDRLVIISTLKMVDFTCVFHEDDPRAFLEIIKPDIHVKGGDYGQELLERTTVEKYGGKIHIVSFKNGRSTTGIIKKINTQSY
jgi:glycerol-3-phosphate cytidylyltransferase